VSAGRGTVDSTVRNASLAGGVANGIKMKLEPLWTDTAVTANVVDVANWPRLSKIYAEAMGQARPARNVVPAPVLHHCYLIEIDAVAMRRQGDVS
jgi:enamine deaminase RidA (YjgF/YER057c/UK114 family)